MNAQPEIETTSGAAAGAAGEGVTIVIPAYNEANGAGPVLEELFSALDRLLDPAISVEVIVVDDGSTDGTAEVLSTFSEPRLRIIRHPRNRGYGAALKTGISQAAHPWILITDADGTYPNEHIPEILALRDGHDMVVGSRTGKISQIPLLRRPPKWVLRRLASYLSRTDIPDLNSGLRVMRREDVLEFENILPDQFSFTSTITLAMLSAGHYVKYTPINYLRREGKSKIRPIADTLNFLRLIVRTIMYFDPLRIFIPVAALFILGSVAIGAGSYAMTGVVADVSTVVLFSTGVQVLAVGMLADTMNRRMR